MGMSASQARLLSLTARMHDLEYQAQDLDNNKLQLSNQSTTAYDEYSKELNSTKYQMNVVSSDSSTSKIDVTYNALTGTNGSAHSMYVLTDAKTNAIYLPEAVTKAMNGSIPSTVDNFLQIVGSSYLYSGRNYSSDEIRSKMASDGSQSYWTAVYYQLTGFTDNNGNVTSGHNYASVSSSNASDRAWITEQVEKGNIVLNKMDNDQETVGTTGVNIFEQTNLSTDSGLSETADTSRVNQAEVKYEHQLDLINQKDKNLDLQLSRIENERNALKTEYDSVKDLVQKNIERSYKTFNA